jgi:hypothetical protein
MHGRTVQTREIGESTASWVAGWIGAEALWLAAVRADGRRGRYA